MPAEKTKKIKKIKSNKNEALEIEADIGVKKTEDKEDSGRYFESVGRRKESIARVRISSRKPAGTENGSWLTINGKPFPQYMVDSSLREIVEAPLLKLKSTDRFNVSVKVKGGGISGQAYAIRHGLARALVLFDQNFAKKMRKSGFLTRDSRVKERRKFGLKKARKAPQWSKR